MGAHRGNPKLHLDQVLLVHLEQITLAALEVGEDLAGAVRTPGLPAHFIAELVAAAQAAESQREGDHFRV